MKTSDAPVKPVSALDLEFPDWSGMDRFTPRLSPKGALLRNEQWRKSSSAKREIPSPKCEVEFIL